MAYDTINIDILEIAGIQPTLEAARLPFTSGKKSDSTWQNFQMKVLYPQDSFNIEWQSSVDVKIGEKDLNLLSALVRNGDEHAKCVRGIQVYLKIRAPRYWWQEMDTYRIGTENLSSESTMHKEAAGLSGEELQRVKGEITESLQQTRIRVFSYQTLRRIYQQRKTHRLPEWHKFCEFIESLPLARELIIRNKKEYDAH